jgi:hypothetical protein
MSHSDFGRSAYGYGEVAYRPGMPEGPSSEDLPVGHGWGAGDGAGLFPLTRELGEFEAPAARSAVGSREPWPRAPAPVSQRLAAQAHGDQQAVGQYLADPYVGDEYLADKFAAAPGGPSRRPAQRPTRRSAPSRPRTTFRATSQREARGGSSCRSRLAPTASRRRSRLPRRRQRYHRAGSPR